MDIKRVFAAGLGVLMITGSVAGVVVAAGQDEPAAATAQPTVVADYIVETVPADRVLADRVPANQVAPSYDDEQHETGRDEDHDDD